MYLPYIEGGDIYDGDGKIIEKPSILIVKNKVVAYGTRGYLSFKKEMMKKSLLAKGIALLDVRIIPLYKYLSTEDCLKVLRLCLSEEIAFGDSSDRYEKFIKDLCKMSDIGRLGSWVNSYLAR